jgi:hypothetical protein
MLNLSMAISRKAIAIRRVSRGFVFAGWRRSFRAVFIFAFLHVFWGTIKKLIIRRVTRPKIHRGGGDCSSAADNAALRLRADAGYAQIAIHGID